MEAAASVASMPAVVADRTGPAQPRLRKDLTIRATTLAGEPFYVVRNPDAEKYCRFRPTEHAVMMLLDGRSTPEQVARRFEEQNPGKSLSAEAVEGFVETLRRLEFLERTPVEKGLALYERLRTHRARRRSPFKNILYIRKQVYDPDRVFTWLLRVFHFLWTPAFVWFSLALLAAAGALVVVQWSAFAADYTAFFVSMTDLDHALGNYLFFLFTFFWMAVIHEACHGMTCKHFGGEVHDVGVLVMYLQMFGFYCNVNDAWTFPRRSHRLWVTLAGGYSGLVLSALGVFLWWLTPPGPAHLHAFAIISLGGLGGILSDFNPLIKLDGYYMLLDILDVPNLQGNSWKHLGYLFKRHILRLPVEPIPATARIRRIYTIYGTLSLLYITLMMGLFAILFGGMLHRRFEEAGWLLLLLLLAAFLMRPVRAISTTARFFLNDKRAWLTSGRGLGTLGLAMAVLAALLFLPQLPFRVSARGQVEAVDPVLVRAATTGRVVATATPGTTVRQGDLLVRLENPQLETAAEAAAARIRETRTLLAAAEIGGRPANASQLRGVLERQIAEERRLRIGVAALEVRARTDGVLDAPEFRAAVGHVVREGEALAEILRPGRRRVRLRIPERLLAEVRPGASARMKTVAYPARIFPAEITEVLPERAPDSETEVKAAGIDPTLVPQAFYMVIAELADQEDRLRPGLEVRVRIDCGRLSPAGYASRWLRRFYGGKMWL